MEYDLAMKTSFIPHGRLAPEVRAELEAVLLEVETLSRSVETSARKAAAYRRVQAEFHARGQASLQGAKRTNISYTAEAVFTPIRERAKARRRQLLGR